MQAFVVLIKIEGSALQNWLKRHREGLYGITNVLGEAAVFGSVGSAVGAVTTFDVSCSWVHGVEVRFKSLCQPNPG